jgi:hypothetical protein
MKRSQLCTVTISAEGRVKSGDARVAESLVNPYGRFNTFASGKMSLKPPTSCSNRRGHRTGGPPDAQVHDSNGVGAARREAHPGRPGGTKAGPQSN